MSADRPTPAIFASAFHPHVGGVEELTRQLAAEQRRRGDDTLVVTHRYPAELPAHETIDGTPVMREAFRVPGNSWRHWAGYLGYHRSTLDRIVSELRNRKTELIHVQCVSNNGLYALRASEKLDLPLVVTMQGELTMDATNVYERSAFLRKFWSQLLDRASAITSCSQYSLDEAEAAYGKSFAGRSRVVYNGIRLEEFGSLSPVRRDLPYVFALGRMVPQKGFDLLIEAFAQVQDRFPGELLLAGGGAELESLRALAASLGARVVFLGPVPHQEAINYLAGASCFVLPSRHEPQGIVVLEAMAAGAPVIAAAVGGVPELVQEGVNGTLFEGSNASSLADALVATLLSGAATTVAAAREYAAGFSWSAITDQYDELYASAVS